MITLFETNSKLINPLEVAAVTYTKGQPVAIYWGQDEDDAPYYYAGVVKDITKDKVTVELNDGSVEVIKKDEWKLVIPLKKEIKSDAELTKADVAKVVDKVAFNATEPQPTVDKRYTIVKTEGSGAVINDLYKRLFTLKTPTDQAQWNIDVRNTKFGSYGTDPFLQVLDRLQPKFPDDFHRDEFMKAIKKALMDTTSKDADALAARKEIKNGKKKAEETPVEETTPKIKKSYVKETFGSEKHRFYTEKSENGRYTLLVDFEKPFPGRERISLANDCKTIKECIDEATKKTAHYISKGGNIDNLIGNSSRENDWLFRVKEVVDEYRANPKPLYLRCFHNITYAEGEQAVVEQVFNQFLLKDVFDYDKIKVSFLARGLYEHYMANMLNGLNVSKKTESGRDRSTTEFSEKILDYINSGAVPVEVRESSLLFQAHIKDPTLRKFVPNKDYVVTRLSNFLTHLVEENLEKLAYPKPLK